jgi:hypothetical protein
VIHLDGLRSWSQKDVQAISKDDNFIEVKGKNTQRVTNEEGWKLAFNKRMDPTTCEPLKKVKESNPVEVSEFIHFSENSF